MGSGEVERKLYSAVLLVMLTATQTASSTCSGRRGQVVMAHRHIEEAARRDARRVMVVIFLSPAQESRLALNPYCDGAHVVRGAVKVGTWLPQNSPAWICWSAVRPVRFNRGGCVRREGTAPADQPLSYRQLKPIHGPRLPTWYCRCVSRLNLSSWSMPEGADHVRTRACAADLAG